MNGDRKRERGGSNAWLVDGQFLFDLLSVISDMFTLMKNVMDFNNQDGSYLWLVFDLDFRLRFTLKR